MRETTIPSGLAAVKSAAGVLVLLTVCTMCAHGQLRQVVKNANPRKFLTVTITPRGLSPAKAEMTEGPFLLRIQNRTFAQTMRLVLTKDKAVDKGAPSLLDSQHTPKKLDVKQVIDPQPGTYYLTVAEYPKLSMTIVIKAKH